jgi:hypothetical protein
VRRSGTGDLVRVSAALDRPGNGAGRPWHCRHSDGDFPWSRQMAVARGSEYCQSVARPGREPSVGAVFEDKESLLRSWP